MAVRYAPFATVKIMSLATMLQAGKESGQEDEQAFQSAVQDMINATVQQTQIQSFIRYYTNGTFFRHIGLADSISISEDFGTRPVYGIGEPTNPVLVPNNMSVRVSISRLTTDGNSIADYVLKPSFYYDEKIQRNAIDSARAFNNSPRSADNVFHMYLGISDIEHQGSYDEFDLTELVQTYEMVEFMPTSFNRRISSDNAIVFTDVEGTGKILKLKDVIQTLSNQLPL